MADPSRLVVGSSCVAVVQPGRVLVFDLPSLAARSEIATIGEHQEIAFVGGDRLAIVARNALHATLFVVDTGGPDKLGECLLRGATRILAVSGSHVLVTGATTLLVDTAAGEPIATNLPLRGLVGAAGSIDRSRFVIVVGGVVQEWDASSVAPIRRVRLDRPLDCTWIGGNAHRIWLVRRDEPDFVEIVTLASQGVRRIEVPEPVARIVQHASGERLAMIGGETRSVYLVDIASRQPTRLVDRGPVHDVAWYGRETLVLQTVAEELALVHIPVSEVAEVEPTSPPSRRASVEVVVEQTVAEPPHAGAAASERTPYSDRPGTEHARAPFSAPAPAPRATEPVVGEGPGWRGDCARWARSANAGVPRELPLGLRPIDDVCARLGLDARLRPALVLLYGSYLAGDKVAPLAIARAIGWQWSEALGNASLARSGLAVWQRGVVELSDEALALLDERSCVHGGLFAGGGNARRVALVVPVEMPLLQIGAWAAEVAQSGPLLVAGSGAHLEALVFEAKLRNALPFVRWERADGEPPLASLAVAEAAIAEALGVPIVASYQG